MWLVTPIGFFSVVQKPGDKQSDTLTVGSRVQGRRIDADADLNTQSVAKH